MDNRRLFYQFVAFTADVHRVKHDWTKDAKPDQLTPVQYTILEYIAVSQPVTLSDISDCYHMTMSNASREIKKLADKKLIEKKENEQDRRKQHICLSKKGQETMDETFSLVEAQFLHRIQHATEAEKEEISRALDVLQAKIFY
ncbi:MarR family winged helix-turn-helix transcriptional regulator [Domibacillus enclensis]|uniref:DNA-binding transcriptional regulator, MarR family n=1 Tax=Domibacillus enclensis TaxID=1017273 RepID=A0A1N7ATF9_9BACI|nr:SMC-Scp complex subunit ScpB [Domibacillus enclensis]OXS75074.1 MarR family transcriptional regulator [Domibacillus enclensis]SIR42302.1 DNA-binding transcriptional regulator, MarR family [Domibacillus enclensis]